MTTEKLVRDSFENQSYWCGKLGSPFTALLLQGLGKNLDKSTSAGKLILEWQGQPDAMGDALALRLAGALHGLVRAGRLPDLEKLYPPSPLSSKKTLIDAVMAAIAQRDEEICKWLNYPPQTNEVARSSILYAGLAEIVVQTGLPLSIFELGSSAGLNLFPDRFAYQFGDCKMGQANSLVKLKPKWKGLLPKYSTPQIIARRGCDLNPLDITNETHRRRIMAYIWPDQPERLQRTKAAIKIATLDPPQIDKADAADWVEENITLEAKSNVTRVLFHSITYQYFLLEVKKRIIAQMEAVGEKATKDTPIAWLAFEQLKDYGACLTLRLWSGKTNDGVLQILATANNAHVQEIEWLAS
jgi:hypothetical protein